MKNDQDCIITKWDRKRQSWYLIKQNPMYKLNLRAFPENKGRRRAKNSNRENNGLKQSFDIQSTDSGNS